MEKGWECGEWGIGVGMGMVGVMEIGMVLGDGN